MKKYILLIAVFLFPIIHLIGQDYDLNKTLKELDIVLENRYKYDQLKEGRLEELKKNITLNESLERKYEVNKTIIDEYNSYISDSAIQYAEKNVEIAKVINNKKYENESNILFARMYARGGLFIQANQILASIDVKDLPIDLREKYYSAYFRSVSAMIDYINDGKYTGEYEKKRIAYADSAQHYFAKENNDINIDLIYKNYWENRTVDLDKLLTLLPTIKPESRNYAIAATFIAVGYGERNEQPDLQMIYLARASIVDTKLASKDRSALINLATLLYANNDLERAYKYAKIALDDTYFYNSKHRNKIMIQGSPIIEKSYLGEIEKQKQSLTLYLIILVVFAIGLVFTCLYIYKQIRIVTGIRRELEQLNKKLDEANDIKEDYIGYFLRQCSIYIDKLDEFRQSVYRKIKAGQANDLLATALASPNTKKEIEELYINFDMAFLKMYPNFVNEFNALLKEEERYKLKSNELNTELRIFALIRLGITDSKQISSFLRYSMQTIYNYRSKVKAKALIDTEYFEERVKNLGIIVK